MEENTLELGNTNSSVILNVEQENEDEILRLQQEIIKSNVPIEDVAKIVGKLQKLLELTKWNTLEKTNFDDVYKKLFGDQLWKPYYVTTNTPITSTPITLNGLKSTSTSYPINSPITTSMTTTSLYSTDEDSNSEITTDSKPRVTLDDLKNSGIPF